MSQIITAIIAVGGTLLGVLITHLFMERSIDKKYKLENLTQQNERLRNRGEELYILVSKWKRLFLAAHITLPLVMQGEISYNDYSDDLNSIEDTESDPHRMQLIIHAYFPTLKKQYEKIGSALKASNKIIDEHEHACKQKKDGQEFIKPFNEAQIKLHQECEVLKEEIIKQLLAIDR
ncbi:MAG: hypothetical protein JKY46_07210 [Robiginitomaculum sp.]|nr:hypothetical protein [Robiginitomaculum sp.]